MNKINTYFLLTVVLAIAATSVEAIFDGGLTLGGLVGLKVAGLIGYKVGRKLVSAKKGRGRSYGRRRFGRSAGDDALLGIALAEAAANDADDCAKMTICLLNAKDHESLAEDEKELASLFGQHGELDVSKSTVVFDLAALIGQKAGAVQCTNTYTLCPYGLQDLMAVYRAPLATKNVV